MITQGKWEVSECKQHIGRFDVRDSNGRLIACALSKANATAIAAVPQMIAALKDFMEDRCAREMVKSISPHIIPPFKQALKDAGIKTS